MSNRVRINSKNDVQISQKMLPMKAIHTFETSGQKLISGNDGKEVNSLSASSKLSPLSSASANKCYFYEHFASGHRSPGAGAGAIHSKAKKYSHESESMRRTASLDALYKHPCPLNWNNGQSLFYTFINVDKATQTDESFIERMKGTTGSAGHGSSLSSPINNEFKMEKLIRQRIQRNSHRGAENSVSSQTLSPVHAVANPVLIPSPRTCLHMKPMRNSVEGLNQEIEKLVLFPGSSGSSTITGRSSDCDLLSRYTPERHRVHYCDLFTTNTCVSAGYFSGNQSGLEASGNIAGTSAGACYDTRSVNTQTPIFDNILSDDSQSTSPDDETGSGIGASPRINKFLAREPPDGCEKVNLKFVDQLKPNPELGNLQKPKLFKPCAGGLQFKPSLGSAFLPLQRLQKSKSPEESSENVTEGTDEGV